MLILSAMADYALASVGRQTRHYSVATVLAVRPELVEGLSNLFKISLLAVYGSTANRERKGSITSNRIYFKNIQQNQIDINLSIKSM